MLRAAKGTRPAGCGRLEGGCKAFCQLWRFALLLCQHWQHLQKNLLKLIENIWIEDLTEYIYVSIILYFIYINTCFNT